MAPLTFLAKYLGTMPIFNLYRSALLSEQRQNYTNTNFLI
jgi:hypothetical protein